jgi:hypothetical protein
MQLLLDLLRGQATADSGSESQWFTVLDLAERENILPWTTALLRALPSAGFSSRLNERFRQIHRDAQLSAFLWTSTLKSTLSCLRDRDIPVVVLKGPWMAERLWGDAALRAYCDLDLLVRPRDLNRTEALLAELGFVPTRRRDDHERPWRRGDVAVDLHHDVEHRLAFDFEMERAWERTQLSDFDGVPARLLASQDELLFLCLHSARHCFARLSHTLDLRLAFSKLPLPAASEPSRHSAEMINILALGAMMAGRLDPQFPAQLPADLARSDRERLQEFADGLWRDRMMQPCAAIDWRAQHDFYLATETRPVRRFFRRLRHWWILLTRLIDADFAFAERFHLRRTWQVWLLRPIRLFFGASRAAPSPP